MSPEVPSTTYTLTASNLGGITTKQATVEVIFPVPTVSLNVSPAIIQPENPVTLSWTSFAAHTVIIEPDIGQVDLNGSQMVNPLGNALESPFISRFYTLDMTAPDVPVLNSLPEITSLNKLTITGSAEANTSITVSGGLTIVQGECDDMGYFSLEVKTGITDVEGIGLSYGFSKVFNQDVGDSHVILVGECYDDATGLPLEGALVQLISVNGAKPDSPAPSTMTTSEGKYILLISDVQGKNVIRISKENYTINDREVVPALDFSTTIFDARLTPRNGTPGSLLPGGGIMRSFCGGSRGAVFTKSAPLVAEGNIEGVLIYPEGAVEEERGTVTGEGGAEIVIEAGSVDADSPVAVTIKKIDPFEPDFSSAISFPTGFEVIGGVDLSLGGSRLLKPATCGKSKSPPIILKIK